MFNPLLLDLKPGLSLNCHLTVNMTLSVPAVLEVVIPDEVDVALLIAEHGSSQTSECLIGKEPGHRSRRRVEEDPPGAVVVSADPSIDVAKTPLISQPSMKSAWSLKLFSKS